MATLGQLWVEFRASTDKFADDMAAIQKNIRDLDKEIKPVTDRIKEVGTAAVTMGEILSAAVTAPIVAVGALGLSFDMMKEQAQISFTTLLGTGERAHAFLEDMADFAAKTPFEFPDLVKLSQRLLAVGFTSAQLKPTLTAIGDAVAGLGGGRDELDRVVKALGNIQTGGRVVTREMNELTMVGINAWKILAEGMGVSTGQLKKMVEEGLVPADKAIKILVEGMERDFPNMMALQSHSMQGLLSTIKDDARFIAGELTEGLFNALKPLIEGLTDRMEGFRKSLHGWSDESKAAIVIVAGLAAAAGPLLFVFGQFVLTMVQLGTIASHTWLAIAAFIPTLADLGAGISLIASEFSAGGFLAGISAILELGGVVGLVAAGFTAVGAAIAGLGLLELGARLFGVKDEFHGLLLDIWELVKATAAWTLEFAKVAGREVKILVNFVIGTGGDIWNWLMSTTAGKMIAGEAGNFLSAGRAGVQALTAAISPTSSDQWTGSAGHTTRSPEDLYGPSPEQIKRVLQYRQEMEAAAEAAKKLHEKTLSAFEDALKPADALNETLAVLRTRFSDSDIVTLYADKILKTAESQRAHGYAVHGATAELEESSRQLEVARGKLMDLAAALDYVRDRSVIPLMVPLPREIPILNPGQVPDLPTLPRVGSIPSGPFERGAKDAKTAIDEYSAALKKQWDEWHTTGQQAINTIIGDMGRMFTDSIVHGKNFWEAFKSMGTNALAGIVDAVMQKFLHRLLDPFATALGKIMDTAANALYNALDHLLGGLFSKLAKKFGEDIATSLGVDTAKGAAGKVASGAAGGAGGAGDAAGASSSLAGWITAGASVVGAIGTIVGDRRMEGTLNAVEFNTRVSAIHLGVMIDQIHWPIKWATDAIKTNTDAMVFQLGALYDLIYGRGGSVPTGNPAKVASAATVTSGSAGSLSVGELQVNLNNYFTDKIDRETVREDIGPELLTWFSVNGPVLQQLFQLLRSAANGVVATAPAA